MTTKLFNKLKKSLLKYSVKDIELIERAFLYAKKAHIGQKRHSGEDYIIHPLQIAISMIELNPDVSTIAAALLHDVVEDTEISLDDIRQEFGVEIAHLVEGVTKISSIAIKNKALSEQVIGDFSAQIENYRKLISRMAGDPRVMIIKLFDRLHNTKTLTWLPKNRQKFYALETIMIYAPIAERLGMGQIKSQIEDNCFPYAFTEEYKSFIKRIKSPKSSREKYISKIIPEISKSLKHYKISARVDGRAKQNYSLFKKLKIRDNNISRIYDLVAIRIITKTTGDCYKSLGVIHHLFEPINGRFADYIAKPKTNGYKSIHTTVEGPDDTLFEVQIRTEEMHENAEFGIASHWSYKENKYDNAKSKNLSDWHAELNGEHPKQFFSDRIYVFSPMGQVYELPKDSTPIDFAFMVHTKIGLSCAGARINGAIAPIDAKLITGDIVEIIKSDKAKPNRDWLKFVKSHQAKNKIHNYLFKIAEDQFFDRGLRIVNTELVLQDRPPITEKTFVDFERILSDSRLPYSNLKSALAAVGNKNLSKTKFLNVFLPKVTEKKGNSKGKTEERKIVLEIGKNIPFELAKCCNPKANQKVIGYITINKTIKIHTRTCKSIKKFDKKRIIKASWR